VLINTESDAKLVDFGTSRRLEDVWVWTRRQGTKTYRAPQVAFEEKRSLVSDIYSVGVRLYEMATGELPYKPPYELTAGRVVKRPREVNANVSAQLEAIILRAMARNPQARYPTCEAMVADVAALLEQMDAGEAAAPPDRTRAPRIPFRPDSSSPLLPGAGQSLPGASQVAEVTVERSDGHPHYLRLLGGIYLRRGYLKAIETYERVLAAYERDFPAADAQMRDVLERLGQLYTQTQRYRKQCRATSGR